MVHLTWILQHFEENLYLWDIPQISRNEESLLNYTIPYIREKICFFEVAYVHELKIAFGFLFGIGYSKTLFWIPSVWNCNLRIIDNIFKVIEAIQGSVLLDRGSILKLNWLET